MNKNLKEVRELDIKGELSLVRRVLIRSSDGTA